MEKIKRIEIDFNVPIDIPPGWDQMLDRLLDMICKRYQQDNPTRVMWPAGVGSKPIWNEPHEPTYDVSIYHVEIAEREDLHGNNPHNPDADRLRKEVLEKRHARRAEKRQKFIEGFRELSKVGTKEDLANYVLENLR